MKHKQILILAVPLLLSSCNGQNFVGTYSFQLGKDKETHMSAFMNLTNNDYYMEVVDPDTQEKSQVLKGKEYNLTMSMDFGIGDLAGNVGNVTDDKEEEETNFNLEGYYNIGRQIKDGSYELRLSVDINGPEAESLDLDSELIESVIFATVSTSEIKVEIPVSMTDLALQLYWYGWDIDFDRVQK